jgi:hypothetical protein
MLEDGCFGFVAHKGAILLAKGAPFDPAVYTNGTKPTTLCILVLTIYVKGGGKRGAHAWVASTDSIGKVSYLAVQLFEHATQRLFRPNRPKATVPHALVFAHIPAFDFLVMLSPSDRPQTTPAGQLQLAQKAWDVFALLNPECRRLTQAVTLMKKRGRKHLDPSEDSASSEDGTEDPEDGVEDDLEG